MTIKLSEFVDKLNLVVDPSRSEYERRQKMKHVIDTLPTASGYEKWSNIENPFFIKAMRLADTQPGEDEAIYESVIWKKEELAFGKEVDLNMVEKKTPSKLDGPLYAEIAAYYAKTIKSDYSITNKDVAISKGKVDIHAKGRSLSVKPFGGKLQVIEDDDKNNRKKYYFSLKADSKPVNEAFYESAQAPEVTEKETLKATNLNAKTLKELIGNSLGLKVWKVDNGGYVKAQVKVTTRSGEVKTARLHFTLIHPNGKWEYYAEDAKGTLVRKDYGSAKPMVETFVGGKITLGDKTSYTLSNEDANVLNKVFEMSGLSKDKADTVKSDVLKSGSALKMAITFAKTI